MLRWLLTEAKPVQGRVPGAQKSNLRDHLFENKRKNWHLTLTAADPQRTIYKNLCKIWRGKSQCKKLCWVDNTGVIKLATFARVLWLFSPWLHEHAYVWVQAQKITTWYLWPSCCQCWNLYPRTYFRSGWVCRICLQTDSSIWKWVSIKNTEAAWETTRSLGLFIMQYSLVTVIWWSRVWQA